MRGTIYFILAMMILGCKKPYDPPAIASPGSYLVVEGVINPSDTTTITLSRVVNLNNNAAPPQVTGATVVVMSDQGAVFPLTDMGNGSYQSPGLNLDATHQYRLSIKTPNNEQYYSDYVPVTITPPIDSVGFNIVNVPAAGVQIYANTHDPTNTIKYYRFDYKETWQFYAEYPSGYIAEGSAIVARTDAQLISVCYASDSSSTIVLASSAKLQKDVIYQSPVTFITSTSEKVEAEYSILVREYALTGDAYNFWTNLKTNTEQLGSIFDAQPSQVNGNIHCTTNPSEPVVGYISASTVTSKRAFIYTGQLPAWVPTYPYSCVQDTAKAGSPNYASLIEDPLGEIPTVGIGPGNPPSTYLFSTRECVDCTIRGTTTPPSFWK